ncbi:Serine protease [Phytophthora cactorum]|nr:Serine protease [Phytophthora cactorum]
MGPHEYYNRTSLSWEFKPGLGQRLASGKQFQFSGQPPQTLLPRRSPTYSERRSRTDRHKTYVTGVRSGPDGNSFCGGNLISPTHVLTASHCVTYDMRWVSIGTHYRNGTLDGEQIRIVSVMNHPNYSENVLYADDFLVLELERPSKFKPVKLAAPTTPISKGEVGCNHGMGHRRGGQWHELLRAAARRSAACERCGIRHEHDGGRANRTCEWSKDDTCGREGYPGVYSRVSNARTWIDSITGAAALVWLKDIRCTCHVWVPSFSNVRMKMENILR